MAFTVKSVFPKLDLPEEVINKQRMNVGMRVRDSWNARYDNPPPKIEEDGFQVNSYDDEFKERAITLIKRFLSELSESTSPPASTPPTEPKKKRPRIKESQYAERIYLQVIFTLLAGDGRKKESYV